MGWAIFIILAILTGIIALIQEIVRCFSCGQIGYGILYIMLILFAIASIILTVVFLKKYEEKREAKKNKEINAVQDLINSWEEIKRKASTNSYKVVELFDLAMKVINKCNYRDIEQNEDNEMKIARAINPKNVKCTFLGVADKTLDFDKLVDIQKFVNKEIKAGRHIVFVDNLKKHDVYGNLLVRIMTELGVGFYTSKTLINDAKTIIKILNDEISAIERRYTPQKQKLSQYSSSKNYGKYKKIFPRVMSSKDDPDCLQALDDIIFMDIMDDDF